MAASPRWKVYTSAGAYEAACKSLESAAALVAFLGDGSTIRDGHDKLDTVWTEGDGHDGQAGESYDTVVETALERSNRPAGRGEVSPNA